MKSGRFECDNFAKYCNVIVFNVVVDIEMFNNYCDVSGDNISLVRNCDIAQLYFECPCMLKWCIAIAMNCRYYHVP